MEALIEVHNKDELLQAIEVDAKLIGINNRNLDDFSENLDLTVELSKYAEKAGSDALLVVTPYYNKPTQEGLYQHYKKINDHVGKPIIINNNPIF